LNLGGVRMQTFNKPSTLDKRKELRKNQTEPEKILWQYLRNRQLNGYKFFRQYGIGEYIADFYSSQLKLVIEIDGDSHFTDEAVEYDKIRTQFFNSLGIEVIRFTNENVIRNIEGVIYRISERIKKVQI
jgi:very-short-patch-repair endonuclease